MGQSPNRCDSTPRTTTPEATKNYLGIDVHRRESYVAVLDEDGEVVEEVRVCDANLNDIAEQYTDSKAVIEATDNYYTIYDTLDEHLNAVVADLGQTKAIGIVEVKNDRLDAKLREQLRRAKMVAESYVPPEKIRERRARVRGCKRPAFKNEVHPVLDKKVSPTIGTRSVWKAAGSSSARISQ